MATNGPNLGLIEYETQGTVWYTALKALLRGLDGLIQPAVEDKDLTAPPGSPTNGQRYIVGGSATGDWATHDGKIARYATSDADLGNSWEFYTPSEGWLTYVRDENKLYLYDGSAWGEFTAAASLADGDYGDITVGGSGTTLTIDNDAVDGDAIADNVALAGSPTTTTQSAGDNSTKIATTAYADNAVAKQSEVLIIAVGDETTAITTGTAKVTFRMPFAMTLTSVRASLTTASSSGNPAVDINEGGVSIFSTTLTIDANEKTSTTAATAAVISDSALADDAEITIDIDTAGTGAAGLKVYLIGTRT